MSTLKQIRNGNLQAGKDFAALITQISLIQDGELSINDRIKSEVLALKYITNKLYTTLKGATRDEIIDTIGDAIQNSGVKTTLPHTMKKIDRMWLRACIMPQGTLIISKIHNTEHPLVILDGAVSILNNDNKWETYQGGTVIITKPGTRRVLYAHLTTRACTFHPSENETRKQLEDRIITKRKLRRATCHLDGPQQ